MSGNPTDPNRQLAAALGRIPSGLFILTARQDASATGMLASWVQQCSFHPPQVTVCVASGREIIAWLEVGSAFTLNILDDTQTDMIAHFGRGFRLGEAAFDDLETQPCAEGGPMLCDALAYLECRVAARHPVGDHDLLIGQVLRGGLLGEGLPMVHVRKNGLHY